MSRSRILLLLLLVSDAANGALVTAPLDFWHWRSPMLTGNSLYGVGTGNQQYVAVGDYGTILLSINGRDWANVESGVRGTLRAVAWGNGLWVIVGDFGLILTSPDGVRWREESNSFFFHLTSVTWGNGLFVAVGENTSILTSTDGAAWDLRCTGTEALRAVTWGNGLFVAGGGTPPVAVNSGIGGVGPPSPGKPLLLISSNAVNWTRREPPVSGAITAITYGADRFVAGTDAQETIVSTDGHNWLPGLGPSSITAETAALAYAKDHFIATPSNPRAYFFNYYSSEDGVSWAFAAWSIDPPLFYPQIVGLAANSTGVVGVSGGPGPGSLLSGLIFSPDGYKWQNPIRRLPGFELPLTFAGGYFFLRASQPYYRDNMLQKETAYLRSSDGQKWETIEVSDHESFGLPTFGNGRWLACGDAGAVAISTNATDWHFAATGFTNDLLHATYHAGTFFLTGTSGTLLTSVDATNWAQRSVASSNTLGEVISSGGIFAVPEDSAAAAYSDIVFVSGDALTWTARKVPLRSNTYVSQLIGWEEGLLALTWDKMLQSRDGLTWQPADAPGDSTSVIVSGGGQLLAFRRSSQVFHSREAGKTNWTTHLLPWTSSFGNTTYFAPGGVAFGRNTFLLTHGLGFVLQSDPLLQKAPEFTQPVSEAVADPSGSVTLRAFALGSGPLQYQWRRSGTNIPGAIFSTLTLPASQETDGTITVTVANDAGRVESPPALIYPAEPAKLQLAGDGLIIRLFGTPGARYRIEASEDLPPAIGWAPVSTVEIPSSGAPMRVITTADSYPPPVRFFRAVNQP